MSETEEQARREAEEIRRQMELLERRRPETEARTRSALRGAITAFAVMALGLALWCSLR